MVRTLPPWSWRTRVAIHLGSRVATSLGKSLRKGLALARMGSRFRLVRLAFKLRYVWRSMVWRLRLVILIP
jgi:hypothetical protein